MKRSIIDEAWATWRKAVADLAETGYYADAHRAERFFFNRVAPVWRTALKLGDMQPSEMIHSLSVTPTMLLMLHFFGVCVLGKKWEGRPKRLPTGVWPPYVRDGGIYFAPAVPKGDVALIVGRTLSAVDRAVNGFRGTRGKAGQCFYDARLVFPAPFATGIMMDGAFDLQLSLPFAYSAEDYTRLGVYALDQRRQTGHTWTMVRDWASEATLRSTGIPLAENIVVMSHRATGTAGT